MLKNSSMPIRTPIKTDILKYVWIFPYFGAVIAFIAFLTPAAYMEDMVGNSFYIWLWGFVRIDVYDPYTYTDLEGAAFSTNPDILIPSMTCSVIIFISIIISFASPFIYRKHLKEGKERSNFWLGTSLIILIFSIVWMIAMDIAFDIGIGVGFWSYLDPGFGVIGMFLGSGLMIIGFGISKYYKKRQLEVTMPKKRIDVEITPSDIPLGIVKFCPECGQKVVTSEQKFCIGCGYELQQLHRGQLEEEDD